jgi:chromate transporter
LTCGKNLLRLLGKEGTPVFGLATIHVFAMVFFVLFYTNGKFNIINSIVSGLMCSTSVLYVGQAHIIDSPAVGNTVLLGMLFLSIYGFLKNTNRTQIYRIGSNDVRILINELLVLAVIGFLTLVLSCFVTEKSFIYILKGYFSSVISFGGGDAYITVADGLFINGALISEDIFYSELVPLVNALPGSILCKTMAGIGYYIGYDASGAIWGAWVVALAGFMCSVVASCSIFSIVSFLYHHLEEMMVLQLIKRWIRVIVSGLMLTVILSLIYQCRKFGLSENSGWLPLIFLGVLCVIDHYLYRVIKISNEKVVAVSAILSLILCNVCM